MLCPLVYGALSYNTGERQLPWIALHNLIQVHSFELCTFYTVESTASTVVLREVESVSVFGVSVHEGIHQQKVQRKNIM